MQKFVLDENPPKRTRMHEHEFQSIKLTLLQI